MQNYILLDGKTKAGQYNLMLKTQLKSFSPLGLATVLVGDDPASHTYVHAKIKACQEVGISPHPIFLDESCSQSELIQVIDQLNQNSAIHGILVQLPLPQHINTQLILNEIFPHKDVDCFHSFNLGQLFSGISNFAPATPTGIMMLLESIQDLWTLESKNVVIVGASNIVGKPLSMLFLQKNATVTIAHAQTKDLQSLCLQADLIVSATGKTNLIKEDMVKQGTVLIDVGINRVSENSSKGYKLVGDMDFEHVKHKAFAITPVPGGVGPMTIAALLKNLYYLVQK